MSLPLVPLALGALAGVVGSLAGHFVIGTTYSVPIGLLTAVAGYFLGAQLLTQQRGGGGRSRVAAQIDDSAWDDDASEKKKKKAAKKKAAKEEAAAQAAREEAAKKEAKNAAQKAKKAQAKKVVEEEDEEDEEVSSPASPTQTTDDEESSAPKSKSALKRAKAKAKELAAKKEAEEAAKKAAEQAKADKKKAKKAEKQGEKTTTAASSPAPQAASAPSTAASSGAKQAKAAKEAKAAAAAAAVDDDGWETVESTRPTKSASNKSQVESNKKSAKAAPVPASERPLVEDLIIPVKHHALIIGPKGETLQKIAQGSGAEITMPKRDSGSAKIEIAGTGSQVAAAKNAINSLVERGFSSLTHPGTLSDDVTIDPERIGFILGANGETLRTIQTKTNTKIKLPEKGSNSRKALIVGEKEDVKAAKAAIRSLLTDGFSTLTHDGWVKQEVAFPADKFGILMGKKGQTVKSIQGNTKTRINLPEKDSENAKAGIISVVGLPAGVTQAVKEINRLLEPLPPLPDPEEEDLATDDAWGQEHTEKGEDALWE